MQMSLRVLQDDAELSTLALPYYILKSTTCNMFRQHWLCESTDNVTPYIGYTLISPMHPIFSYAHITIIRFRDNTIVYLQHVPHRLLFQITAPHLVILTFGGDYGAFETVGYLEDETFRGDQVGMVSRLLEGCTQFWF